MPWFVKTERFLHPYAELKPHLQAHRAWVEQLRGQGVPISSGYLVDGEGQPGGGGLLLLECASYAEAEALVAAEANGCRFIDPEPGHPYVLARS